MEDGDADKAAVAKFEIAGEDADASGPAYRIEVIEEAPFVYKIRPVGLTAMGGMDDGLTERTSVQRPEVLIYDWHA